MNTNEPSLTAKASPSFAKGLADSLLKMTGWKVVGSFPTIPKYIMVGAPHTSNWDFPLAMMMMYSSGVRFNWVAKASLFKPPFGEIFKRMGGIPVWRDRKLNFTQQIVEAFHKAERMVVAIAPEGTRSLTTHWKTGFYYMALGANVPILMGFVDYSRKQVGAGPLLYPSGDLRSDFEKLRAFYSTKVGRYPEKAGKIEIRDDEALG